ncbi:MAG: hypothetical protein R3E76_01550 [Planctomycetota bacterium]
MKTERAEILMNRAIDGTASLDEREQLARAMSADPLLRNEFEELQSVHASTNSLFNQLELPTDFAARVMRRVQGNDVPADSGIEQVRLPSQRRGRRRVARVTQIHQRRVRVYAIVATVSAAAALMLALGVFSGFFTRAGIGATGTPSAGTTDSKAVADGRQGGPDSEEINRTVSSTHQPLANPGDAEAADGSAVSPDVKTPEINPTPADTNSPIPKDQVKKGDENSPEPTPEEPIGSDHEPRHTDVVDDGTENPAPPERAPEVTPKDESEGVVESGPKDETSAVKQQPERVLLGRISSILSGRVEVSADAQTWTRISENQELFEGDHVRTLVNGSVLLLLDSGSVSLDKRTQVTLDTGSNVLLDEGTVALDRNANHAGDLHLRVEDYTVHLSFGCAVIERKRRGLSVQKPVGFASLSHDEFGTVLLDTDAGYAIDAEFGKVADEPRTGFIQMPGWAWEARSQLVMLGLEDVLNERDFAVRERSYVTSRLPGGVNKLVAYPTTTQSVTEFVAEGVQNEKLNGAAIIKMVGEVQVAYAEVSELTPDVINNHAKRAALVAENYDQWRDTFWRLMRPPVEPKNPPSSSTTETECPLEKNKIKQVEKPRKPIVKKVPAQGSDTPEKEDAANKN